MADEDLNKTIPEIAQIILDIITDCDEAFKATDKDYQRIAQSALTHWQPVVISVQSFHPYLFTLNNLLSLLNEDRDFFQQNYRDLLLDLNDTCREYEPFGELMPCDFVNHLDGFLHEMLSDVETDGEGDADGEGDDID
jgi:hypothetical protein